MSRKPSGVLKPKPASPLRLATRLPSDAHLLCTHVGAGWTAFKADTAHFPAPPNAAQLDAALKTLGDALDAAPGGTPAEQKAVKKAATKVREQWHVVALYAQGILRTLPVEDVPPILATVLLYKSAAGAHKPKPPLLAKHGAVSGSVIVVALAIARALTYGFEVSADQLAWSTTTSGKCRVTISGLTPGKLYWFRVRAFLRDGTTTDYVHAVSLTVV